MTRPWIFFLDLTPDIARIIVECAAGDPQTAHALLLTSKTLSQWVVPWLYREVHLRKKNSAAKFLAALDASLDLSFPSRGQYVKELIVYVYQDPTSNRDLLPDIFAHTTALKSFTWQCKSGIPFPDTLPSTLKTLNIRFYVFDQNSWPAITSRLKTATRNIEELQVATKYESDPNYFILRKLRFAQFTSLKYISLRSQIKFNRSVSLVAHIRHSIIPQFPPTLKVCVLYDFVWRSHENKGALSDTMKELIMGYVDDRIVLSVDSELDLSPNAPYSDFILRTSTKEPFVGQSWSIVAYTWEEIVTLTEKRRQLRMEQSPQNQTECMVKDYAGHIKPIEWAAFPVLLVPVLVYLAGEAIWKKVRH
ncbi:hypothetical protein DL96DRAFT_1812596 [Flagelloscypha sp. PMI_526]|nr:hypothetical protein DL96DRAFT_1812596 [Flagelloscypha sp. PMI_526]